MHVTAYKLLINYFEMLTFNIWGFVTCSYTQINFHFPLHNKKAISRGVQGSFQQNLWSGNALDDLVHILTLEIEYGKYRSKMGPSSVSILENTEMQSFWMAKLYSIISA